jgi:protein involved in polysaccharide export with SLBB domain
MPANSNDLPTGRVWITRRLWLHLMIGSWLWTGVTSRADEPAALPAGGASACTPKPDSAAGTRFPVVSLGATSQAGMPGALGTPGAIGMPGTLGTPPAFDSEGMATLDDQRGLAIGDHLCFRILEDHDDPKPLVVTDSGEVEVPYVGRVQVRGMSCKQLAAELKKRLEAKYYYHATVIISVDAMGKALGKVYFSGALRTPGPWEIPGNEVFTLSKGILCAGGFTDFADKHIVRVTRRSESKGTNELFTVDVGQILEKGRTDLDMPLEPGDMVFVPVRLINF